MTARRTGGRGSVLRRALATTVALAAAILGAVGTARAAESVVLRDGRTIVGEISRLRDGSVAVHTAEGTEIFRRDQIERISAAPAAETAERSAAGAPTLARILQGPVTTRTEQGREVPRPFGKSEIGALREQLASLAEEEPVADAVQACLRDLESSEAGARTRAMLSIRERWPRLRPVLRAVLILGNEQARLDVARLLRDPRLGDTTEFCDRAVRDGSLTVRMHALRAIREKELRSFAPLALEILDGTAPWTLRQEAARALERIGDASMLATAVRLWEDESDAGRKRRYRRLLRALHGSDLGDDPQAWIEAARGAESNGSRETRRRDEDRDARAETGDRE